MNHVNEPLSIDTGTLEHADDISTRTMNELLKKYESIVYDYLAIMNSSETLKAMDSAKYTVQLGLNAITHIYKIAFCRTKNVATSADHCQKGIYCFIEYIEQTYKLGYVNMSGNNSPQFDFMDAIMFIYDKTLSDLRNDNSDNLDERTGSSAFTNILSVSQTHQAHGVDLLQCKSALEHFGRITTTLLWFSHPTMNLTDQMEIVDMHLTDFLGYGLQSVVRSTDAKQKERELTSENFIRRGLNKDLFLFLETVQETIESMEKKEYVHFLLALKKQMKKQEKSGNYSLSVLPACLHLKTLNGMTLKEIEEHEKWKKPVNDLAKLAFQCG